MRKMVNLLIRSLVGGVLVGISGFVYCSALRISGGPMAVNCQLVTHESIYPLGHLVGSIAGIVPLGLCGVFKLPVFVGRLSNIFNDNEVNNRFASWEVVYVLIGNLIGIIGLGVGLYHMLKKTFLLVYNIQVVWDIIDLNNKWGMVKVAINSVFGGVCAYASFVGFNRWGIIWKSFLIYGLFTFMMFYSSFGLWIVLIFWFSYASSYSNGVFVMAAVGLVGNFIGANLILLVMMNRKNKKVEDMTNDTDDEINDNAEQMSKEKAVSVTNEVIINSETTINQNDNDEDYSYSYSYS